MSRSVVFLHIDFHGKFGMDLDGKFGIDFRFGKFWYSFLKLVQFVFFKFECFLRSCSQGHFGEVWKGFWTTSKGKIPVAIKTCHEKIAEADKATFMTEARIMRGYIHPNVVRFIGVAAQSDPMMIVMELVPSGFFIDFYRVSFLQGLILIFTVFFKR